MRVRQFTQNDAHIFSMDNQITSECVIFCELLQAIYKDFGFADLKVKFSDRPEIRAGDDKTWDKAENALLESLSSDNLISEPKPINFNSDKRRLEKLLFLSKIYNIQGKETEVIKIKDSIIKTYQRQDNLDFNIIENRLVLYEKEKEINKNK